MRLLCGTVLEAAVAVAGGAEARRNAGQPPRLPLIVGFALEYHQFARIVGSDDFVNEPVRVVYPSAPATFPIAKGLWLADSRISIALNVLNELVDALKGLLVLKLPASVFIPCARREIDVHGRSFGYAFINSRRLASPRSKERMESARTRWFASEKNGSGVSVITSKGRRRRITIWRRNSLTPLEMSSPARLSNSSASWRRSESMRICKVDVAMLKSFVVRLNDIVPYHQSYYNRVTRQSDGISFGHGDPCGVMARTREQEGKAK